MIQSDGLGTFRCIAITLCPPDFNGEEGSPCNGTCPCNDGLDCSDNIHICVNPDAPINCGCGEPNPAYPGDPNAVPCLCNLGNGNCPGFGGSCGGSPLGSACQHIVYVVMIHANLYSLKLKWTVKYYGM